MRLWRRFVAWLAHRYLQAEEPTPADPIGPCEWCEVCGIVLAGEDVWEIRSSSTTEAERAEMREMGITSGGTYMSATYCAEHFPAGHERWART